MLPAILYLLFLALVATISALPVRLSPSLSSTSSRMLIPRSNPPTNFTYTTYLVQASAPVISSTLAVSASSSRISNLAVETAGQPGSIAATETTSGVTLATSSPLVLIIEEVAAIKEMKSATETGAVSLAVSTALPTSSSSDSIADSPTPSSILDEPVSEAVNMAAMEALPSVTTWNLAPTFSALRSAFSITSFATGESNLFVVPTQTQNTSSPSEPYLAVPSDGEALSRPDTFGSSSSAQSNLLRVEYPAGSINPANKARPVGGGEFYANPMESVRAAGNVTLEYSVYFPEGFDFVKGGKLPGLYGGHKGCSGGDAATDCFSTRLMWRPSGLGEVYLYAPKSSQSASLCSTPPKSICEAEYGLSIGRGAWTFKTGEWTHVRQDVWLNTPGQQDGGFNIFMNGELVLSAGDVFYRNSGEYTGQQIFAAAVDTTGPDNVGAGDVNSIASMGAIAGISPLEAFVGAIDQTTQANETDITENITGLGGPAHGAVIEIIEAIASQRSDTGVIEESLTTVTLGTILVPMPTETIRAASVSTELDRPVAPAPTALSTNNTAEPLDAFDQPSIQTKAEYEEEMITATQTRMTTITVTATSTLKLAKAFATPTPTASAPVSISSYIAPIQLMDYTIIPPSSALTPRSEDDTDKTVGFTGIFFSTFFGGHSPEWASPTDQYTYFKDFSMRINAVM